MVEEQSMIYHFYPYSKFHPIEIVDTTLGQAKGKI